MKRPKNNRLLTAVLVVAAALLVVFSVTFQPLTTTVSEIMHTDTNAQKPYDEQIVSSAENMLHEGRNTFRYNTFGDEVFWGDTLKLHKAILGEKLGGIGEGLSPENALKLGLKVDSEALPSSVVKKIKNNEVDLKDPATTVVLLKNNAIVGVKGVFSETGKLTSIGITCAFCHSTVDDSFSSGIGKRLDGWPNRDLNVGAIIALAPDLSSLKDLLQVDEATLKKVLLSWGPGKYDAILVLDGKAFAPDGKSAAVLIPPAYGLAGVNLHTWTGWGSIPYWNAFVAKLQMHGQGKFFDMRLKNYEKYPIATRAHFYKITEKPDLISPTLAALHFYQLSLPAPQAALDSFDKEAAERGSILFNGKARCATCHIPPLFTENGYNLHTPSEIGIDSFQADRSPTKRYRTAPLKGLWAHQKGGFYHDGRFETLLDVVNHYNSILGLQLTKAEKQDLVEYLKSL